MFQPLTFSGWGASEACYQFCAEWQRLGHDVTIHTVETYRPDTEGLLKAAIPKWLPAPARSRIARRFRKQLWDRTERRAVASVRAGDICHFWPGANAEAVISCKRAGAITAFEFFNTYAASYFGILREAAAELGLTDPGDGEQARAYDDSMLASADIAISSGPFIGESIRRYAKRYPMIVETSYGSHFPENLPERERDPTRVRFLFVGLVGMRKGAHYLLDAWAQADLDAELVIVGKVEPDLRERFEKGFKNIRRVGFTRDLSEVYREADVFVFPSLEEGDPLVTHMATAHGLPLVVTPMGGGRSANAENALIVPPRDSAALAEALRTMAASPELRQRMGKAARESARRFDYRKVAKQRIDQLLAAAEEIESEAVRRAARPSSS